jgi:hypothetical protein
VNGLVRRDDCVYEHFPKHGGDASSGGGDQIRPNWLLALNETTQHTSYYNHAIYPYRRLLPAGPGIEFFPSASWLRGRNLPDLSYTTCQLLGEERINLNQQYLVAYFSSF